MNNTYIFLGNMMPFIRNNDIQKFEDYKMKLAYDNMDYFNETDKFDFDSDSYVCSSLNYVRAGISHKYEFFCWGFIEYTKNLTKDESCVKYFVYCA